MPVNRVNASTTSNVSSNKTNESVENKQKIVSQPPKSEEVIAERSEPESPPVQNLNIQNINSHEITEEVNIPTISSEMENEPSPRKRNPFDNSEDSSFNVPSQKIPKSNPVTTKNKVAPVIMQNKSKPVPVAPMQEIRHSQEPKSVFDDEEVTKGPTLNLANIQSKHTSPHNQEVTRPFDTEEKEKQDNIQNIQNINTLDNINNEEPSEFRDSPNDSPKNDLRSEFTQSNIRNNMNMSRDQSFISVKDKMRNFQEIKASLETQLELSLKKSEVYEREMQNLRKTVNELKLQLSKTNEESYKLEIARLKQNLAVSEKEKEMLRKENQNLKLQAKKYEDNIDNIIEENKKFRNDTQKKFAQYNKEIENLTMRSSNITTTPFSLKESVINKKDDLLKDKEDENFTLIYGENTNANNFKRDANPKKKNNFNSNNDNLNVHYSNQNNHSFNANENVITHNKSNVIEIDEGNNNENVMIDNRHENNFTNGSPNLIEEVGADNYLNMNGNTYDEMKDLKQDDDNLQDHQYYESHNQGNANYDHINMEYSHFNSKKANTGDTYNSNSNHNLYLNNNNNTGGGESGATNNIFGSTELEKEDNVDSIFNYKSNTIQKNETRPPKEKSIKAVKIEKENKASNNITHTNKNVHSNVNKVMIKNNRFN